jgi:hypothetical protein
MRYMRDTTVAPETLAGYDAENFRLVAKTFEKLLFVHAGSGIASVFAWRLTRASVKDDGEVALVRVADMMRDLRDRQLRLAQQRLCEFDSALSYILVRRQSGSLLERMREMIRAHR